ncbi:integrase [Rugamonas sp. DEMB1]|uniref:integrase n=1 Tax=Rugamonas sp. DEMB1 TaxID=3039386 RepID=UPI002448FAC9|nr:integrase [Rugamonas sp. DEMB1]WGG52451.1 integrase [Rugamonas sp. DEMB1]
MTPSVNPLENLAVVRLLEFLSERSPWNRSLWGIGVVLALDELYEGCAAMAQGHLSEASIKRLISSLNKRVGLHPGFTGAEKKLLNLHLQQVPRPDSVAHYIIRQISSIVSADYLTRWGRVLASGIFNVELFARSVAAHLLDAGFSEQYLHDFINTRIQRSIPFSLARLCDDLQQEMIASPPREIEVLLAFGSVPRLRNGVPPSWLQGPTIIAWLRTHGFDTAGVRAPAALVLRVRARDAIGAAQVARSESDRYAARTLLATGHPLNRLPKLWVAGSTAPVDLDHERRGVEVRELYREDRTSNRERSRLIGGMIIDGSMPALPGLSDQAAVTRMRKLFHSPKVELETIREVISDSFHRLYRQRNLILHGGKLDSVALTPGLRTVAKLAGAGMDRVTHGHYVQNLKPLELVAKANIALALVDATNPLACVELLEAS